MLQRIHSALPSFLKPLARTAYAPISRARHQYEMREFRELKAQANGMLSPQVYQRLQTLAEDVSGANMVEIGAAHGASTIALASGGQQSAGETPTLFSFEKGEGGSRSTFGDKTDNIRILHQNLQDYGVEDVVEVIPERLTLEDGLPPSVLDGAPFALLCIDADGNIHREFELLYDLLVPGAIIVIDDFDIERDYREVTDRYPLGGGKAYRTFCYTQQLLAEGWLWHYETIDETFFGVKPPSTSDQPFDQKTIEPIREHLESDRERFATGTDRR